MRLLSNLLLASRSALALGLVVFQRVPALATECSLLLIASQLSKMAAFLIPLKALYVAGSPSIPAYFNYFLGDIDHDELVIVLSGTAVTLYILHLTIDFLKAYLVQLAVQRLLSGEKLVLIEAGTQHMTKAFEHVVRAISTVLFSLLLVFGLSFLVDGLMAYLTLYFMVMLLCFAIYYQKDKGDLTQSSKKVTFHIGVVSAVGFLCGFVIILWEVMKGGLSSIILAVIALILLRLLMNQITGLFRATQLLHENRGVYSHLLSGEALLKKTTAEDVLLSSVESGSLDLKGLWSASAHRKALISYCWVDSFFKGALHAQLTLEDGESAFVKIYAKNARSAAEREGLLLPWLTGAGLSPAVISEFSVDSHYLRVSTHMDDIEPNSALFKEARGSLLAKLMAFEPPAGLLDLVPVANVPIHRRVELLPIVTLLSRGRASNKSFEELISQWPYIQTVLDKQPLQLVVRAGPGTIGTLSEGSVVCRHWEKWAIEPVGAVWDGAGLPAGMNMLNLLNSAKVNRPALSAVATEQLELVHTLCRLEVAYKRQRLATCADAITQLAGLVSILNSSESNV